MTVTTENFVALAVALFIDNRRMLKDIRSGCYVLVGVWAMVDDIDKETHQLIRDDLNKIANTSSSANARDMFQNVLNTFVINNNGKTECLRVIDKPLSSHAV